MTLHDWIDELCDALDVDAEVDEALILDLARDAAHAVERKAAPVTTFLLGYAAALAGGSPERTEALAAKASALAEAWARGGGQPDPVEEVTVDVDEEIPVGPVPPD